MAGTRRSPQAERARRSALVRAVERSLAEHVAPGARIAVALSGGRDSVALLAAVIECGRVEAARTSSRSTSITAFRARRRVGRVLRAPRRAVRHRAASRSASTSIGAMRTASRPPRDPHVTQRCGRPRARPARVAVLLAHHQDDQAETAAAAAVARRRRARPRGDARRATDDGLRWLRPLLDIPRRDVDAFVRARGLAYVDDDSNASDRHRTERAAPARRSGTRRAWPTAIPPRSRERPRTRPRPRA